MDALRQLDNTILTHAPNTQSDADKMSTAIGNRQDDLKNIIYLARGVVTEEKLREKEELEDGVMRVIE